MSVAGKTGGCVSIHNPKIVLIVAVLILLVVAALWGVLTYGVAYPFLPSEGNTPGAADVWTTLLVLAIGLLAGYLGSRYLLHSREPPGGIWTVLAAGVGGAWLGGLLPSPGYLRWQNINVAGAIVLAFALVVGVGRLSAYRHSRGGK